MASSTDAEGPVGKCRVVGVAQTREPHRLAVYAKILVEDEAGKRWSFETATFNYDLKPEPEGPPDALVEDAEKG